MFERGFGVENLDGAYVSFVPWEPRGARPEPKAETRTRLLARDGEGYRCHSVIKASQPTWYMRTMLSSAWQPGSCAPQRPRTRRHGEFDCNVQNAVFHLNVWLIWIIFWNDSPNFSKKTEPTVPPLTYCFVFALGWSGAAWRDGTHGKHRRLLWRNLCAKLHFTALQENAGHFGKSSFSFLLSFFPRVIWEDWYHFSYYGVNVKL